MTQEDESPFYGRVFWLTTTALLALALLSILKPFFESILWAGLLAFLLASVTRRLTLAFRGRRSLAALLVTLAVALFVLIPAVVTVASSGAAFAGVLGVVVEVTLTLFLLLFSFVRDGEQAVARGLTLIPLSAARKEHLVGHLSAVTRAVALGTLLTAAWAPPSFSPSGAWWWSPWWTTSSSRSSSPAGHRSRRCQCSSA